MRTFFYSSKFWVGCLLSLGALCTLIYLVSPTRMEQAKQYESSGKFKKAERIYRNLLKEGSRKRAVMDKLIVLYRRTNQKNKEARMIRRRLSLREQRASFVQPSEQSKKDMLRLGQLYTERGKYNRAVKIYRRVLPDLSEHRKLAVLKKLSRVLRWNNRVQESISPLEEYLQIRPENREVRRTLIVLYRETSQKKKEARMLRKLLSLNDDWTSSTERSEQSKTDLLRLAEVYTEQGSNKKAVKVYRKVLPDLTKRRKLEVLKKLSRVLRWNNRVLQSISPLEQYLEIRPENHEVRRTVIELYRKFGMTWKTLPHLRYLLHHDPDGNGSLQLFARAFESAGQVGNAILVHHLRLLFEGSKKSTVRTIASLLRSTQNLWLAAKYYRFLFQFSAVPETETVRFLEFYYEQHQQHGELDELYRILSQRTGKKEWRRRQIQLHSSHLKTNRSTELAESYLEDYPEDLEAWTMLGRMYRDREEQAKYLEVRKRIARRFPDEVDASWDSGFVLWDAGRKSEALRIFERTMKQVDVIPEKRLEVARLHADQGNYSRALDHMETLQENQNLPHSALPDLAYFARQANERDRGLRIIMNKKRSMDATGSSVEARTNVARALALVGRPRQALRIYKDLTREKPEDHELLLKIGRNLMAVEQFREARSYFLKVLAVRPEHEEALKRAGQASVWIEEHRAAVKYLERYLSVVPEDVQASYLLGEVHYAMGDSRKGFYRQRSTVSLFEANPPADATETMMFARASARIGHIDRSMSLYKTILENQELSEDLADSYMKTLLENRLYEKALHLLNTRFATFANRPNFRQFRARIYANTNRMRQARQILMEVERQQDREVGIWMDLGFINKQLGYWNESMYYLEQAIDASGDTLTDKPRTSLNQRRGILREKRPRAQFSFIHHLEGEDVRTGGTVSVQHPISEFMEVQLKQSYHHVHAQLPVGTSDQEVADIRVTGLNVTYAENENTTVTGGANVISSGETGGGLYGFMEHTFSSTETTLEFEAKYNQLWQEPVRPSALNGRRNGASLAVTQNLGKRMELYLEGEGAQVSIDGDDGLPGQGDGSGTEFQGTARMSYVTHKAPFLSFSLSHRHVNYSGDDSLFALLPLAERTNVTAVNVYHEHQWDRHWTGVLSGGAGTDFSRNVGLLYFGRCEVRARPISRFHGWAAYEHSSETATSDAGSSHRFELGLEVTF